VSVASAAGPLVGLLAAAEAAASRAAWLFAVSPLLLAVAWLAFTGVLAAMAGHGALLARFPPIDEEPEAAFRFASGRMRWVNYNNALHVRLGARGLHLAPNAVFRPVFRRGIPCIPWSELRLLRSQAEGWVARFRGSKFEVRALGLGFTLYGRAGIAVERKLASLGLSPPDHARAFVRER